MPALIQGTATERALTASSTDRTGAWSFTVILSAEPTDEQAELLYARCADATLGVRAGVPHAAFDRAAPSLPDAVDSALRDIEETLSGVHVVRVEPDELVNAADIARRTGRTRASVSQLIEGERGPGNFPAPRAWMGQRPLWDWLDVAGWFAAHYGIGTADVRSAAFLSAVNSALGVRRLVPRLTDEAERRALARLISQDAELLSVSLHRQPANQQSGRSRRSGAAKAAKAGA